MKIILHSILSLILAAPLLAEITSKQIQGFWKFVIEDEGIKISSISAYLPKGVFTDEGSVVMTLGEDEEKLSYSIIGQWELEDDTLIITVTKSSAPQLYPKGMIIRSKVTKASDKEMTFVSELDDKEYKVIRTVNPSKPKGKQQTEQVVAPDGE